VITACYQKPDSLTEAPEIGLPHYTLHTAHLRAASPAPPSMLIGHRAGRDALEAKGKGVGSSVRSEVQFTCRSVVVQGGVLDWYTAGVP
jgi:hypothetical protein